MQEIYNSNRTGERSGSGKGVWPFLDLEVSEENPGLTEKRDQSHDSVKKWE